MHVSRSDLHCDFRPTYVTAHVSFRAAMHDYQPLCRADQADADDILLGDEEAPPDLGEMRL